MQILGTKNTHASSLRNKLMLACALVMAGVLAAPGAMAHDRYRGHRGDNSGKVLGALVVGAVIGGVIASASQHNDTYYGGGTYYPAQPYPPQPYYESYPGYSYGGGYYGYSSYPSYPTYPSYSYGPGVSVGVVYSSGDSRYRGDSRGYYRNDRSRYDGHRNHDYGHGGRGQYYPRRDR